MINPRSPADRVGSAPREYSLTTGRKVSQSLVACVFLVSAGFFLKLAINPIGRDFVLFIGANSLIFGILLVVQAWTSRLMLDGDRIEVRSALRTRAATLIEIKGSRKIANQYGRWTRVYLKEERGSFSISEYFKGNDSLQEWLKGVPDLDGLEASEIAKQVGLQAEQGTAPSQTFKLAKTWAIGFNVLAGASSIPVILIDQVSIYTASLILLLLCPILGMLLLRLRPLLFTIFKRKPDPRADLSFLLFWPGIALVFSYQTSNDPTHLVDFFELSYCILSVLVLLLATVLPVVWRGPSRWSGVFFLIFTLGLYSIGFVKACNSLLDQTPPSLYESRVTKKTEHQTSKGTTYSFLIAPWGPFTYSESINIPLRTYQATSVGDRVCFGLHPGFLHAPWYNSARCGQPSNVRNP